MGFLDPWLPHGLRMAGEWLAQGEFDPAALAQWLPDRAAAGLDEVAGEAMEDAAYAPYLARQETELRELRAGEAVRLAGDFPYAEVPGLSNEMLERLSRAAPATLAAAGRVAGITPAALSAVLVHARKRQRQVAPA